MKKHIKKLLRTNWKEHLKYPYALKKTIFLLSITSMIAGALTIATAYLTKYIVDQATSGNSQPLVLGLITIGIVYIAEIALSSALDYYKSISRAKSYNQLQKAVFADCFKKDWLAISQFQTGELLTRINNDTQRILEFWLNIFPEVLGLFIRFVLSFSLLWQYDKLLATVSFLIAPMLLIMSYPVTRKLKRAQSDYIQAESTLQSYITETIQNLTLIKVFNHEHITLSAAQSLQDRVFNATRKRSIITIMSHGILILGFTASQFLGLLFGAWRLSSESITFGTFSALILLIAQIQGPLTQLGRTIPKFVVSLSSSERLTHFFKLKEEESGLSNQHNDFEAISFNQVAFHYDARQSVLKNFNWTIAKGQRIGVIGPSGSGKTTLSRLLLALIKPTEGEICLQQVDGSTEKITKHSRGLFAYVPQENILFSGTIRDNLKLAYESANDDQIHEVLTIACAWDFIEELPQGLNTHVGERGIGLSQGQIQRLCIARALLYEKPILILDEATSALDDDTETMIVDNLKQHRPSLTLIAITHRPNITSICHQIINLKKNAEI